MVLLVSLLLAKKPTTLFTGAPILQKIVATARREKWTELPFGELVAKVGLSFQGTPYVGFTLETDDKVESCVVKLDGLDCVTFYESSLGIARMLVRGKASSADLANEIRQMRYRGGKQTDYLSRIHYTSEWFDDNDRRGIIANLTPKLPGVERIKGKPFDFMSSHPKLYRQLRANPDYVVRLAAIEKALSDRAPFYLPKLQLPVVESLLESGDVIGITTSKKGLDTSHTALLYRDGEGCLRILHASSTQKKVVLGDRLVTYLNGIDSDTGIIVGRPLPPKR
jgi:hypothetical protein